MVIALYGGEKPAVPRRTWVASVLLLVLTSALAWAMTKSRSGETLGPRLEPTGWSISFRPPRRFPVGEFGPTKLGTAYRFYRRTPEGGLAVLAVFRLEGTGISDARVVCERVLSAHTRLPTLMISASRLTRFDRKLGPLDAVEIWDPQLAVVVRAAVLAGREAYAVSLRVEGRIDQCSYSLFQLICASGEYQEPAIDSEG